MLDVRTYRNANTTRGLLAVALFGVMTLQAFAAAADPTDIGSRRELFIDSALIESLSGGARQQLHHPVAREVAVEHDADWEGTGCGYHNVFQDGDKYRMYYNGRHLEVLEGGKLSVGRHPYYLCYAESDDGIHWTKPNLGLVEHNGSTENNIVMKVGLVGGVEADAAHAAVFLDENPDAPADARYKAFIRSPKPLGMWPFKSPDGLHWTPMSEAPVLQGIGAFDSQNLTFWDPTIKQYRAYWRVFSEGTTTTDVWKPAGYRAIRTATSDDMVNWGPHTDLSYEDSPDDELYTNQIKHYHRAPHILLGFPARYIERGWSQSMRDLPNLPGREMRASSQERYGTGLSEGLVMSSRDGVHFKRWNEAFMRPGPERPDAWQYGQQFIAWHAVETKSHMPGAANELSLYAAEGFWHGAGSTLRRYTLRLDGFVSVSAPMEGGELITKSILFEGSQLALNFATSAAGSLKVALEHADGSPIAGYALDDCDELFGDTVDRVVTWGGITDVGGLAGQPVRLRVQLRDADLYAFKFSNEGQK